MPFLRKQESRSPFSKLVPDSDQGQVPDSFREGVRGIRRQILSPLAGETCPEGSIPKSQSSAIRFTFR
jgi:hypothetical protein